MRWLHAVLYGSTKKEESIGCFDSRWVAVGLVRGFFEWRRVAWVAFNLGSCVGLTLRSVASGCVKVASGCVKVALRSIGLRRVALGCVGWSSVAFGCVRFNLL